MSDIFVLDDLTFNLFESATVDTMKELSNGLEEGEDPREIRADDGIQSRATASVNSTSANSYISGLASYTAISPNKSVRTTPIEGITIHHMAGNLSIEDCGKVFAPTSRKASANYGIGSDGRIACYVPENYRAWTSSSSANDNRCVTIEVANSIAADPWPVSAAAFESLLRLCADICLRNGIKALIYTGNTNGNLTAHRWFAATLCPGPYLYEKFPAIAKEVTKRAEANTIYSVQEEDDEVTREEVQSMIDLAASDIIEAVKTMLVGEYTQPSNWIVNNGELEEAKNAGITDATRPQGYAKREEVAAMVLRAMKKCDVTEVPDEANTQS